MELYHADTGKLLCAHYPTYGKTHEVGAIQYRAEDSCGFLLSIFISQVFDELGYLAIPPCIWGTEQV